MVVCVARAQQPWRDRSGHYEAPKAGQPLCTLRIHVTGFRNQKGQAGGAVYASPQGWPENLQLAVVHGGFSIGNREATETFQIPPGRYGVVVIHDENRNHKLDRNFLGIPKEGFGFANNPHVLLTAPPFQTASVEVGCPVTEIDIHLIYK
ncbi:MAG: DUF2141 domain-containing protein [Acidobacteriaceae bacterium]